MNLHSNKPGKEIELAWLKSVVAFCNTEGGRIFIGVKDDGEVIGFDADRFSNDDKTLLHIQNLIKQHVGLEFSKYISYKIIKLNGIGVLVIRCLPTSKPVFLKFNEKEQFFVRTGPASIELPVSKALEYIKDRNKS
jgi:predicted HTH transcriptional regulator